jgi:hypothetical protein
VKIDDKFGNHSFDTSDKTKIAAFNDVEYYVIAVPTGHDIFRRIFTTPFLDVAQPAFFKHYPD